VRCAIGDGAVPFRELLPMILSHRADLTAVLEPGALEARHVRLLTPDWWQGYPAKSAQELAACLRAAQVNRLPEDADWRTPLGARSGRRARGMGARDDPPQRSQPAGARHWQRLARSQSRPGRAGMAGERRCAN
jgi:hypothetical protein